jgi:DNA-binding MarR family transcriptional regulator
MSAASRPGAGSGPDPGACDGALSDDLGWALGVIFRSYLRAAAATFAGLPGGPRGYQVLAAAARGEPGSQLALARHLGVDRTVMTYLLDDLEGAGLIERRPDRADRRARRIAPTTKGRRQLAELDRRLRTAEQQLLAGLGTEQDRRTFRSMLRQLAMHADHAGAAGSTCESLPDVSSACSAEPAPPRANLPG